MVFRRSLGFLLLIGLVCSGVEVRGHSIDKEKLEPLVDRLFDCMNEKTGLTPISVNQLDLCRGQYFRMFHTMVIDSEVFSGRTNLKKCFKETDGSKCLTIDLRDITLEENIRIKQSLKREPTPLLEIKPCITCRMVMDGGKIK